MTDNNSEQHIAIDRFGCTFGSEHSMRRAKITAAAQAGEGFDGLTDRDVVQMMERAVHKIMEMQTYRGRFTGDLDKVGLQAAYLAGSAASEDAIRIFDAIAEGNVDLAEVIITIRKEFGLVAGRCEHLDRRRRDAERAGQASVLADAMKRQDASRLNHGVQDDAPAGMA